MLLQSLLNPVSLNNNKTKLTVYRKVCRFLTFLTNSNLSGCCPTNSDLPKGGCYRERKTQVTASKGYASAP